MAKRLGVLMRRVPMMTSEWPLMYLVQECITRSTPKSRGLTTYMERIDGKGIHPGGQEGVVHGNNCTLALGLHCSGHSGQVQDVEAGVGAHLG